MLRLIALAHFLVQENMERREPLNEVAFTFWFFLQYRFNKEINEQLENTRNVNWENLINGKLTCKNINSFLIEYERKGENKRILDEIKNGGIDIYKFHNFTRFLNT